MIKVRTINKTKFEVINTETGKVAECSRHSDYFMGKETYFWRIDVNGRTVDSLIRTKTECIASAKRLVK